MTDNKFLTVKEVRDMLGVESLDTVRILIKSGELRAFKAGRAGKTSKWLIEKESVDEYVERSMLAVAQGVKA